MKTLKKLFVAFVMVSVTLAFAENVYGNTEGKLIYYKNGSLTEERVRFGNISAERKTFLLLKVLVENRLCNGLKLKYTFLDEGSLCVGLNDVFNTKDFYEKLLITEQITKTACSVEGVESIMIYVD